MKKQNEIDLDEIISIIKKINPIKFIFSDHMLLRHLMIKAI